MRCRASREDAIGLLADNFMTLNALVIGSSVYLQEPAQVHARVSTFEANTK
jgi:hypothetical protein